MSNATLIKNFTAEAAMTANRIVKIGANDGGVLPAAASTDILLGAVADVAAASGERQDVILSGIADITLGGNVTRGNPVTSDASGRAVNANPAAGVNAYIVGFALQSGVSGDIVPVLLSQGRVQG